MNFPFPAATATFQTGPIDLDELKLPPGKLRALIEDAVAMAKGFRGKAEISLIDQKPCLPKAMLAAVIYCYLRGLYGSDQIEEAFKGDEELSRISQCQPDRHLLRKFRRMHRELIQQTLKHLYWFLLIKHGAGRAARLGAAPGCARPDPPQLSKTIDVESGECLSRAAFVDKMMSDS